jgi:hypothetical protein
VLTHEYSSPPECAVYAVSYEKGGSGRRPGSLFTNVVVEAFSEVHYLQVLPKQNHKDT